MKITDFGLAYIQLPKFNTNIAAGDCVTINGTTGTVTAIKGAELTLSSAGSSWTIYLDEIQTFKREALSRTGGIITTMKQPQTLKKYRKSIMNEKEELTALLENTVVEVEFTKVNGDLRKMKCTKNFDSIPNEKHPIGKGVPVVNDSVIRVYDVDADGWRSFRADSIKTFKVVK